MVVNKPEQASTEMTKVLKSIADTIDGKSNTDCAATSEISKWTKYVGNKLAENGGSSGGSGVQPDWNQNDGAADDYIKNRPFYEVKQPVTLLDGTFAFESNEGIYGTESGFAYDLIEGETYTVTFDNVTYKCSAIKIDGMGNVLGNSSIVGMGDDTGEPFVIGGANPKYMIVTNTSEGNHSVSVVGNAITTITKVPEQYLPPVIGRLGAGSDSEIFNDYEKNAASGRASHAEGILTTASGDFSHAEGSSTTASGMYSHAEGDTTKASGNWAHAEGRGTLASSMWQHVQGRYNIEDTVGTYAHIVGNGSVSTDTITRSNAHTIDWSGNGWFAGTVEGTALILKSSTSGSSKRFKITVDDTGAIKATEITG